MLALLGACITSQKYPIPRLEEKNFHEKSAIVILKTYSTYMKNEYRVVTRWSLYGDSAKNYSFESTLLKDWKKYIPGYLVANATLKFNQPVSYDAYELPPGRYILEEIECTINDIQYKTPERDGWDVKKNKTKWAEFTIKSGETIYLGEIQFHFEKEKAGMSIDYNLKTAQEFLKTEFPWLKRDLVKRELKITWDKQYHSALKYVGPPPEKEGVYQ